MKKCIVGFMVSLFVLSFAGWVHATDYSWDSVDSQGRKLFDTEWSTYAEDGYQKYKVSSDSRVVNNNSLAPTLHSGDRFIFDIKPAGFVPLPLGGKVPIVDASITINVGGKNVTVKVGVVGDSSTDANKTFTVKSAHGDDLYTVVGSVSLNKDGTLTIKFESITLTDKDGNTVYDANGKPVEGTVKLSHADIIANGVPEPASMLLLGSGLVSLAAWRRRKMKHNATV